MRKPVAEYTDDEIEKRLALATKLINSQPNGKPLVLPAHLEGERQELIEEQRRRQGDPIDIIDHLDDMASRPAYTGDCWYRWQGERCAIAAAEIRSLRAKLEATDRAQAEAVRRAVDLEREACANIAEVERLAAAAAGKAGHVTMSDAALCVLTARDIRDAIRARARARQETGGA